MTEHLPNTSNEETLLQALGALEEVDRVMQLVHEEVFQLTTGLREKARNLDNLELRQAIELACDGIDQHVLDAASAASQNAGNFGVAYLPRQNA